ncbi:MAG: hypothetical protein RRY54_03650 [Angelakisella sp.]
MAIKLPKISIKMPAFLKNKKIVIIIVAVLVTVLLVAAGLFFFRSKGKDKDEGAGVSETMAAGVTEIVTVGASDMTAAGVSAQGISEIAEEPKPTTVLGTNITQIGLCIVVPERAGIVDPNVSQNHTHQTVTTFNNGKYTEIALHYGNDAVAHSTMTALCLQAFDIGDAPPETLTYELVADIGRKKTCTYDEIADKVLYNADGKLVVDVTFAGKRTPKSKMEERIDRISGKGYSYDWMFEALDYIEGHIKEMVVPIQYAASYSLEALGYTMDLRGNVGEPPYPVAVPAKTIRSEEQGENGHSGLYTADVYGGERLLGDYTALQPTYSTENDAPTNPSSFALLQAFKKVDLARSGAGIRFLRRDKPKNSGEDYFRGYSEGPFSEFSLEPAALQNYVVYENEAVVVYNFFDFAKPPSLDEQLQNLSNTEGYEQYGIRANKTVAMCNAVLNAPGGLGQYIRKK